MSFNPYESSESPAYPVERPQGVPPIMFPQASGSRPVGLTILAVLHFMQALFYVALMSMVLVFANDEDRAHLVRGLGFVALLLAMMIGIGVGYLRGANWGWRVATFFYVAQVVQPIFTGMGASMPGTLDLVEAVASVIGFIYLFTDKVLAYFGLWGIQKIPTALRIIGICTLLLVLSNALR